MQKLSYYFLSTISLLTIVLTLELLYMYNLKPLHVEQKNELVKLVGLPDLALSNSANFIRHRSYSDTFSLFANGPELMEYFPSTFTYNYTHNNPSRIEKE